jgi:hypothetical protein
MVHYITSEMDALQTFHRIQQALPVGIKVLLSSVAAVLGSVMEASSASKALRCLSSAAPC